MISGTVACSQNPFRTVLLLKRKKKKTTLQTHTACWIIFVKQYLTDNLDVTYESAI